MLDNLYEDIGGKIKNWAKWIFVVEAIGAIITGFVLLFEAEHDEIFILYGLLTMVVGPIVAWVGSWILYAFGELVEDVHAMRNKETSTVVNTTAVSSAIPTASPSAQSRTYSAIQDSGRPAAADEWKCTCGKIHKNYESSCVCGVTKAEAKAAQNNDCGVVPSRATPVHSATIHAIQDSGRSAGAGEWKCTCGRIHKDYEYSCLCGVTKAEAKAAQNK